MIARHITTSRGMTTVETPNGTERRVLPARSVLRLPGEQCEVSDAEWARGIPQELELTEVTLSVADMKRELHKVGVWTAADMRANPSGARAALVSVCGDAVKRLIEAQ